MTKLQAPNPDTNGVKVDGYDRIERNKSTGLFEVNDSNLTAKLQAPPWNFTVVPEPRAERSTERPADKKVAEPEPKKVVEEEPKVIDDMTKAELADYINERSAEPDQVTKDGFNRTELLEIAHAVKANIDRKNAEANKDS